MSRTVPWVEIRAARDRWNAKDLYDQVGGRYGDTDGWQLRRFAYLIRKLDVDTERRDGFAGALEQLAQRPMPNSLIDDVAAHAAEFPDDYPADPAAAARLELVHLWTDLAHARMYAANGSWSMQCDNLVYRIMMLSKVFGATHSDKIDVDVVLDGLYERLHREAGIEHPPIDWDGIRKTAAYIAASAARVKESGK